MVSYEAAGQVKMLLEMEKEIKQADARPKQNAKEGGGRK